MRDGLTLPLVVKNMNGSVVCGLLTNEKGFRKSIENSELWIISPETGRLLPWDGAGKYHSIEEGDGWYSAIVDTDVVEDNNSREDNLSKVEIPEILTHLSNVIHKRKLEMPKGSYTTHLFEKGLEKIKKKTGEEAIELILAEEPEEIVYEAADLIYHMMVLLEESGVTMAQVLAELGRREG